MHFFEFFLKKNLEKVKCSSYLCIGFLSWRTIIAERGRIWLSLSSRISLVSVS